MLALASHSIGLNCTLFRKIEHAKRNIKFKQETCPQNAIKKKSLEVLTWKGCSQSLQEPSNREKYRGLSAFLKFGSLLCWGQKRNTFHVLGRPLNFNPGNFEEHFGQSSGFELAT